MFERKALKDLVTWFQNSHHRKPLLIRGARQVGKTTLVRMLARHLDVQLVEINLEKPWSFTGSFADLDPRRTIEAIEFELNIDIDPARSLLFFDEAQACPSILPMLRYFYEEANEYRVIATGSLLEFVLAKPAFSTPVGRLELYHLGPLAFQEFLAAIGETKALAAIEGFQWGAEVPDAVHEKLNALVRLFCVVGGMPEAVAVFSDNRSLRQVEKTKSEVLETLRLDFNKYQGKPDSRLLQIVFDALPNLLGRKLVYSRISPEFKTRELSAAVRQLNLAGLITRVHHSSANGLPLAAEKRDRFFKPLLLDAGLLMSQLKILPLDVDQAPDLNLINKGALAEQFIGQHLLYLQPPYRTPELFYWCRERPSASAEVDYLLEIGDRVVPVEVKSGAAGKLRSLQVMVKEKSLAMAVRFCTARPSVQKEVRETALGPVEFTLVNLPHYLAQQSSKVLADIE